VSRFGVPLYLVTDRGRQFESELFDKLSSIIGFHRLRTTAYHPQSNGIIERVHRTIKTALKARGGEWLQNLPAVLLGLRSIPTEGGLSPFTAITGSSLLIPAVRQAKLSDGEFITSLARSMREIDFRSLSEGQSHSPNQPFIPKDLFSASHVWIRIDRVRKPLEAPYSGPFKVDGWKGKVVTVIREDGSKETVSMDRIKPAIMKRTGVATHSKPSLPPDVDSKATADKQKQPAIFTSKAGRKVHFPAKLAEYI